MANEDKATRYRRLRRRASLLEYGVSAILLVLLLVTGTSAYLYEQVSVGTGASLPAAVAVYALLLALIHGGARLPFLCYRDVSLAGRYGSGERTGADWVRETVRTGTVRLAIIVSGAVAAVMLIRWDADRWWMAAAGCLGLLLLAAASAMPMLLPKRSLGVAGRSGLAARLAALAVRAGIPLSGIQTLADRAGDHARALLLGFGRNRRVLLSETLLADHPDDEVAVIVAHELGHHVHRDLRSSLGVEVLLITAACIAADLALGGAGWFGLNRTDPAALPLVVIGGGGAWVLLSPLAHAWSRRQERRADRYALDLTRDRDAFIRAMHRMAARHLAEDRPSRAVDVLFASHPSPADRIEAARGWTAEESSWNRWEGRWMDASAGPRQRGRTRSSPRALE